MGWKTEYNPSGEPHIWGVWGGKKKFQKFTSIGGAPDTIILIIRNAKIFFCIPQVYSSNRRA